LILPLDPTAGVAPGEVVPLALGVSGLDGRRVSVRTRPGYFAASPVTRR